MTPTDILFTFTWWGIFLVLGIINLPLTFLFFRKFLDRGYILAKIIGMAIFGYPIWLLGSLHLLPFGSSSITAGILITLLINGFVLYKNGRELFSNLPWKFIILEEFFFCAGLFFWAFIRGNAPDIRGLEKFMDYGFMNTTLRSTYFPPKDMWLPPLTINYYYFGHSLSAFLTLLSGIKSEITYNLMLATLFGFTFTGAFSLALNLFYFFSKQAEVYSQKISDSEVINRRLAGFAGIIAALLTSLGGNLHTIVYVLIKGPEKYWYPDATRYIPFTIHEFPIYSFVVSDLHGHVLDIPFVMLILSLILAYFMTKRDLLLPFLGFMLGISFMTNAWDFPIYLMVLGFVLLFIYCYKQGFTALNISKAVSRGVVVLITAIITSLPFNLAFKQIAQGVAPVNAHSPFYMLLVLWGFPLFMALSLVVFLFRPNIAAFFKAETLVKLVANIFGIKIQVMREKAASLKNNFLTIDGFVLILLGVSFLLIIFPEIFYIKDIYIKEYHRANTMFKFVYQSFMMFGICEGYIVTRILYAKEAGAAFFSRKKLLWFLVFSLGFISVMIYPYFAINSYYGNLKTYKGLDGISWLKTTYPADAKALSWIKQNIKGQPTILEPVGDSYTDYGVFSSYSGIPTVLGWPVHEWLWRGSYDEAGKRTADVQQIYESTDINNVKTLLKKYKVTYAIVNGQAKTKYKNLREINFVESGKMVFSESDTKIYKIDL